MSLPRTRLVAPGLLSLIIGACAGDGAPEPVLPAPCQPPPAAVSREIWRADRVVSLVPAGDDLVVLGSELPTRPWRDELWRISPGAAAVNLTSFPSSLRHDTVGISPGPSQEVFHGVTDWDALYRRSEIWAVPIGAGPGRRLGLARLDWKDEWQGLPSGPAVFAADEHAVYFFAERIGADVLWESAIYTMSRADGSVGLLARTSNRVRGMQLAAGYVWWVDGRDDRVWRVPVVGPPLVELLPIAECYFLLVTTEHGLFCGDLLRGLFRHDSRGQSAEHLLAETDPRGGMVPLSVVDGWLWLQETISGNLRRLELATRRLEDVVCGQAHERRVAVMKDRVVWIKPPADFGKGPTLVLEQPVP